MSTIATQVLREKSPQARDTSLSANLKKLAAHVPETIHANARYQSIKPVLSIASPYFRDDPTGWLAAFATHPLASQIEAVVIDDGTNDPALDQKVRAAMNAWPGPGVVVRLHNNLGRALARNRAIEATHGEYVLFIDADMVPNDAHFLDRYYSTVKDESAAVVFGGFTTSMEGTTHDTRLNASLALAGDCKPANERVLRGPVTVASNNLLVRRDVLINEPFDAAFKGWGWEDTEWALRVVNAGYGLVHLDNPAVHVGLESTKEMLRKYAEAGSNLRRLIERHPDAGNMLGAKMARMVQKVPLQKLLRPLAAMIATDRFQILPMAWRRMAIKFWRASYAAEAFSNPSSL